MNYDNCAGCKAPHDGIKHRNDPFGRYCAKCVQRPPYDVLGAPMEEKLPKLRPVVVTLTFAPDAQTEAMNILRQIIAGKFVHDFSYSPGTQKDVSDPFGDRHNFYVTVSKP